MTDLEKLGDIIAEFLAEVPRGFWRGILTVPFVCATVVWLVPLCNASAFPVLRALMFITYVVLWIVGSAVEMVRYKRLQTTRKIASIRIISCTLLMTVAWIWLISPALVRYAAAMNKII